MTQLNIHKSQEKTLEHPNPRKVFAPLTDIVETPKAFLLYSELPGVAERDIDLTLDKNTLLIKGKFSPVDTKEKNPLFQEYLTGDYERAFSISNEINRDEISASLVNGVLKITLPKAKEVQPRKINVKASE
jgi:HSP20 family molecular chaperone IbpA